jgi:pyruvate/2-oxoacid:ferredoxin oxidoreductase alpha subunit
MYGRMSQRCNFHEENRKMKKLLTGNYAASYGAILSRAEVISAYPITPQTQIVEKLSTMVAEGKLDAEFINVESERSALAVCMGASATGARAFTATSAQGLALMHELLHWAAGARLPLVLVNVNRAMAPGWTVWCDENDSLSQRDTGWIQLYCESNQEVLDTVIQAYKIAEKTMLPVMICMDGIFLSHTQEVVDLPEQEKVDRFLSPYKPPFSLDTSSPHALGSLTPPHVYFEFRYKLQQAMDEAQAEIEKTGKEFGNTFGRDYGLLDEYLLNEAEIIIVALGTVCGTCRVAIDRLNEKGNKVGMLRIRTFRPLPKKKIIESLKDTKKVIIIDRNISYGHHGILHEEIKSAFYRKLNIPLFGFIAGLGGRDITPEDIEQMVNYTLKHEESDTDILWWGVNK